LVDVWKAYLYNASNGNVFSLRPGSFNW